MDVYDKILKLSESELVQLSQDFKNEINKNLHLGHSRYLVRYGVLSDGHDRVTPAQRYFASIKEMWMAGNSVNNERVRAMNAQADLMDAKEDLENAWKASDQLRAKAKILQAETQLTSALVNIEDLTRQLDEFNKVRLELKASVEAQYPEGVEQAELDNWMSVAKLKFIRQRSTGPERFTNVPLPPERKAELGYEMGRFDMIAPLAVAEPDKCALIEQKFQEQVEAQQNALLEYQAREQKRLSSDKPSVN